MALLIGTDEGVFRADDVPFEDGETERVIDGRTTDVLRVADTGNVLAATFDDLYRSRNGGRSWERLGVPGDDRQVWSALATPNAVYAGTDGPALFRSTDEGETWDRLDAFDDLPSKPIWQSPVDPDRARVRTLASPPGHSNRIVVGIEAGGVHVSEDGGKTWTDRRAASPDDVHQLFPLGADEWLLAAGYLGLDGEETVSEPGGVHHTTDAGRSWTRLDDGNEHAYVRGVFAHDGVTYFCGSRTAPGAWRDGNGTDSVLFESTNGGDAFERVSYPGEPRELVMAWTAVDGAVVGGTGGFVTTAGDEQGRVIRRADDGWDTVGSVPGNVHAIESI